MMAKFDLGNVPQRSGFLSVSGADHRIGNCQTEIFIQIATLEEQMAILMASLEAVRAARDGWKEIAARYGCPMVDVDPVRH